MIYPAGVPEGADGADACLGLSNGVGRLAGLSFENVHFSVKGRAILNGIDGWLPASRLLAVLGPSGAGKTSLLDVLAGCSKAGAVEGTVQAHLDTGVLNLRKQRSSGVPVAGFHRLSGYVINEDGCGHLPLLTVRETFEYALALLYKDPDFKEVEILLSKLALETVAETFVGSPLKRGISGGEMRRMSIGVSGLIQKPAILFLDEPTSGLDSHSALHVMQVLRSLCDQGQTVACTIHQPRANILMLFDQLLLIHQGWSVFHGPLQDAMAFFTTNLGPCPPHTNPADYMLDALDAANAKSVSIFVEGTIDGSTVVTSGDGLEDSKKVVNVSMLRKQYAKSQQYQNLRQQLDDLASQEHEYLPNQVLYYPFPTSYWNQLVVLTKRAWKISSRDMYAIWGRIFCSCFLATVNGTVQYQKPRNLESGPGFLKVFSFTTMLTLLLGLPCISRYTSERVMFLREHASGLYAPDVYVAALLVAELPALLTSSFGQCIITYYLVGMRPGFHHFLYFYFVQVLALNIGYSMAHVMVMLAPPKAADGFYMTWLVLSYALDGAVLYVMAMPRLVRCLTRFSVHFYAMEATAANEFAGLDYGDIFLDQVGLVASNSTKNVFVLVGVSIALRLCCHALFRLSLLEVR